MLTASFFLRYSQPNYRNESILLRKYVGYGRPLQIMLRKTYDQEISKAQSFQNLELCVSVEHDLVTLEAKHSVSDTVAEVKVESIRARSETSQPSSSARFLQCARRSAETRMDPC
jgi:hypothetical protein